MHTLHVQAATESCKALQLDFLSKEFQELFESWRTFHCPNVSGASILAKLLKKKKRTKGNE
jgi:hypothetical protein